MTSGQKIFLIAAVALFVAACSTGPEDNPCRAVVHGACIVLNGLPANYALNEDAVIDQTRRVIERALAAWGAPADLLDGFTITINWAPFQCGGQSGWTGGCSYPARKEINIHADSTGYANCPAGSIFHEIGHVWLFAQGVPNGDPRHADPLWQEVPLAAFALEC